MVDMPKDVESVWQVALKVLRGDEEGEARYPEDAQRGQRNAGE